MDQASRGAPPHVPPVVVDGVRYEQAMGRRPAGVGEHGGWLLASDDVSGELLWTLRVYEVVIDPADETDVQERYFGSMARIAGRRALRIACEHGETYEVDLDTRRVTATA